MDNLIIVIIVSVILFCSGVWVSRRYWYEVTSIVVWGRNSLWISFAISVLAIVIIIERREKEAEGQIAEKEYLSVSPDIRSYIESLNSSLRDTCSLVGTKPDYKEEHRFLAVYLEGDSARLDSEFNDVLKKSLVYSPNSDSLDYMLVTYVDYEVTGTYGGGRKWYTETRRLHVLDWKRREYVDSLSLRGRDAPNYVSRQSQSLVGYADVDSLFRCLLDNTLRGK